MTSRIFVIVNYKLQDFLDNSLLLTFELSVRNEEINILNQFTLE
jgi:hypothetical protein